LSTTEHPAGLGWRLGARVVDAVVFTWLAIFVLIELDQRLLGGDPLGREQARLVFDSARSVILLLVLIVAYEVVPLALFGATAGKAVMGLRVRLTPSALPVGLVAVARAALLYLPPLFLGALGGAVGLVLLVSVVVMADGRGLHDRLLGTLVVMIDREDR
jgi:uncharacterized RDD family membrane protein YckC